MDYPENIGIFTIINKIAETKKSIVFLGEDTRLKRLVAIKTLKPGLEEERTTQFIKEGQRLAMIETHPNLVQVYTSGVCENGQPFLVMQYVQGKTLEERLSEDPLNKKEAEKILKEVVQATAYLHSAAHEQHNDIIPRNVILGERGTCLVDLGGALNFRPERFDDIQAIGHLAKNLEERITEPNKSYVSTIRKRILDGELKTAKDIENAIYNEEEKERRKITRRKMIGLGAKGLIAITGGLLIYNEIERRESLEYTVSKIKSINPEEKSENFKELCKELLERLATKYEILIDSDKIPRKAFPYNIPDGTSNLVPITNNWEWTTGFWPGILWTLSNHSKKNTLKKAAEDWTNDVAESHSEDDRTIRAIRCFYSYVKAYETTGKKEFRIKGLEAARRISELSKPDGDYLRYYSSIGPVVYLDNMELAIPLMLWANKEERDEKMKEIILRHSKITIEALINEDGSSIQCASKEGERYAPALIKGFGKDENSCFSRSHIRGINGFLSLAEHLKEEEHLRVAELMINYALTNMPKDRILKYDFKDQNPEAPIDTASTSALALALGMHERITNDGKYAKERDKILHALITRHLATNREYQGVIKNGFIRDTLPKCGIIYGDHSFIMALEEAKN
ncbi:protein kinase [Candidatus Pacearchaeota archaeon]|nr:protein kinase [Candidatus Pacearchaeota archaeon]